MLAQFLWSLAVLILCVGFGGYYLLKQLGWFGGLAIEGMGVPASRWSRWRRRLTALLLMVLGVLCFAGVNWIDRRADPLGFIYFAGGLALLCLLAMLLGWQDMREIRRLGRRAWTIDSSRLSTGKMRQYRYPGGNGGSHGEGKEG